MARRASTRGKCVFCGKEYSKAGMSRHLGACAARKEAMDQEEGAPGRLFHIRVVGTYDTDYWMHLEAPADLTLQELDQFLRNIWLECCGHLSAFEIEDMRYLSRILGGGWMDERDMDVCLSEVLAPGLEFSHQYDFGSTTHLSLRVVNEREGRVGQQIKVMARNDAPKFVCAKCEKLATQIGVWYDYVLLCDACAEQGEYNREEGFLPVVNSPRMGVCGYTG